MVSAGINCFGTERWAVGVGRWAVVGVLWVACGGRACRRGRGHVSRLALFWWQQQKFMTCF